MPCRPIQELVRSAPRLRARLRRCGLRGPDVDDAFQEVALVVLRRAGSFAARSPAATFAWLGAIARRVAANRRRAVRRHTLVRTSDVDPDACGSPRGDPHPRAQLADALRTWSARHGPLLADLLRERAEGRTLEAAARAAGTSPRSARRHLARFAAWWRESM